MTRVPAHAGFARYRTAAWRDTNRHRVTRRFSCSVAAFDAAAHRAGPRLSMPVAARFRPLNQTRD
ncbi:hypothetical protein B7G54_03765 [Burkholderia puraquae]|uniref:Uncharacterized protein n=1 Tax=Burkholderia puraquae TaxID=1904757 RepID=A0A1X1PQK0_9BURK|nr:hypothetical protein B7G54_03765 [Burkholderia puraquae]